MFTDHSAGFPLQQFAEILLQGLAACGGPVAQEGKRRFGNADDFEVWHTYIFEGAAAGFRQELASVAVAR